jgi:predicted O-linked N-acetylglucosamine transferase (SPINDLY family)
MSIETTIQRAQLDAQSGRIDRAIDGLRFALRLRPNHPQATGVLGRLLVQAGRLDEAERVLARLVQRAPTVPDYRNNLANVLAAADRPEDAAAEWRRAIDLDANFLPAYFGLCEMLVRLGRPGDALDVAARGLSIAPDFAELAFARVGALEAAGRVDEAADALGRLIEAHPREPMLAARRLVLLNYLPRERAVLTAALADYASGLPKPGSRSPIASPDPDRPLRLGILSGDLRTHSVAYFVEALLRDPPEGTAWVAFSTSPAAAGDELSQRLRRQFDTWIEAGPLDDAALARSIREQRIDVLVELSGHFSGNRLSALSSRPAPVVLTAIGYPASTGHPAIDWRLVDSITDPPGSEGDCRERLLRLDPCFLCYTPPASAPAPSMPEEGDPITFGSFNIATKISEPTVRLWSAVLAVVRKSRLLVKSRGLDEETTRLRLLDRFEQAGVARDRLELVGWTPDLESHLSLYHRVHVALDTTPYSGTTTTCEALWMGVPVVTLLGGMHRSRVSASLLAAAGLSDLVASDPSDFVRIACELAGDRARLVAHRVSARERLAASPLLDGEAYKRRVHAAIRECWKRTCAEYGNG